MDFYKIITRGRGSGYWVMCVWVSLISSANGFLLLKRELEKHILYFINLNFYVLFIKMYLILFRFYELVGW